MGWGPVGKHVGRAWASAHATWPGVHARVWPGVRARAWAWACMHTRARTPANVHARACPGVNVRVPGRKCKGVNARACPGVNMRVPGRNARACPGMKVRVPGRVPRAWAWASVHGRACTQGCRQQARWKRGRVSEGVKEGTSHVPDRYP